MKKELLLAGAIALSVAGSGHTAFAEDNTVPGEDNTESVEFKTDEELDVLRESGKDFTTVLTDEQAVERAAELSGETPQEVLKDYQSSSSSVNTLKSNRKMMRSLATTNDMSEESASSSCHWIETTTTVAVSSSYKPKLSVIVRGCRSGSFSWLKKTKPFYIGFIADNKKFAGDIRIELQNDGFDYLVNGRFYNNSAVSHGTTTGITDIFTATYSLSVTSDFYKSIYTGMKYKSVL